MSSHGGSIKKSSHTYQRETPRHQKASTALSRAASPPAYQIFLLCICFIFTNEGLLYLPKHLFVPHNISLSLALMSWDLLLLVEYFVCLYLAARWANSKYLFLNKNDHEGILTKSVLYGISLAAILYAAALLLILSKHKTSLGSGSGEYLNNKFKTAETFITNPSVARIATVLFSYLEIGLFTPLIEELLFRKTFLTLLTKWNIKYSSLIVSTIFALLHRPYTIFSFLLYFLLSSQLNFLYLKTGRLAASVLCHASYNSMMVISVIIIKWSASFTSTRTFLAAFGVAAVLLPGIFLILFVRLRKFFQENQPKLETARIKDTLRRRISLVLGIVVIIQASLQLLNK